jgi:uncharacterized membrane protein
MASMKLAAPNRVFFSASGLLGLAITPAWFASHGQFAATAAIFTFFSKVCHQRPERSFMLFGAQVAVCVRCVGIYAGAALGSLLRVRTAVAIRALGAALIVNCADIALELLHIHGNTPLIRLLIGGTLGIALGAMFSAAEIQTTPAALCDTQSAPR